MELVRILLPPSEAKAPGGTGPALRELGLGPAPLATTRHPLLTAAASLSRRDPVRAAELLRVPPAVAAAAETANAGVLDAPTMPALDRFTGVLYEAFSAGTLTPAARRTAEEVVVVFDGAFGVLRGGERVPDHRA